MKQRFAGMALAATMVLMGAQAHAQDKDDLHKATGLMRLCSSEGDGTACFFYVMGVLEGLDVMSIATGDLKGKRQLYCPPDGMRAREAVTAILEEIGRDPTLQEEDVTAGLAILVATQRRFPKCDAV